MASKPKNLNLGKAKGERDDEFYTQLTDIEHELRHYTTHFRDKVVYCNCDDPRVSEFFHYFSYNFEMLGLKKLVTTCYKNQNMDLFSQNNSEQAVYLEYYGDQNGNRVPDTNEINVLPLKKDGDFRSDECRSLLEQADVVVTNPPFSLFTEYVEQLIEYNKKFIIIGPAHAVSRKRIFQLFKSNQIWLGYGFQGGNAYFKAANPKNFASGVFDKQTGLVKFRNVYWYTNLDISKRHEEMLLYKQYDPDIHPEYDNFNAIEIKPLSNMPVDYKGVMGVPITFLDKYNPAQFEIIGSDLEIKEGLHPELVKDGWKGKLDRAYLNGERLFSRLFVRVRR